MSTIDVAFVIDSSAVVRDKLYTAAYADLPNYGQGYVFGVTKWDNVNFGTTAYGALDDRSTNEGGPFLDVGAENQDIIKLRAATLSVGFGYQCFIKSMALSYGAAISTSPPTHKADAISYLTQDATGAVVNTTGHDDYWEIALTSAAKAQYHLQFYIVDSDARIMGGFSSYLYISAPLKSRYAIG